jgi:hypothetical protein
MPRYRTGCGYLTRFLNWIVRVCDLRPEAVYRRAYEDYARQIPQLDVIEREIDKVIRAGEPAPEHNRVALLRLAMEIGRLKREGVIMRLALDDTGILPLSDEERRKIVDKYLKGE